MDNGLISAQHYVFVDCNMLNMQLGTRECNPWHLTPYRCQSNKLYVTPTSMWRHMPTGQVSRFWFRANPWETEERYQWLPPGYLSLHPKLQITCCGNRAVTASGSLWYIGWWHARGQNNRPTSVSLFAKIMNPRDLISSRYTKNEKYQSRWPHRLGSMFANSVDRWGVSIKHSKEKYSRQFEVHLFFNSKLRSRSIC